MVVTRLRGGLGNQMFQYALGRTLAASRDDELFLERGSVGSTATMREYGLDLFDFEPKFISLGALAERSPVTVTINQNARGFHEEVLRDFVRCETLVLNGYWISEKYFSEHTDLIRRDFKCREVASLMPSEVRPRGHNSVAVHVRRGDYLAQAGARFGFVGLEYYRSAVECLMGRVESPHFFVFSDDIDWCAENLRIGAPHTFVMASGGAEERRAGDFRAMSACSHFIVANSTFSWWAAWLGTFPRKLVVAPRLWFHDDPLLIQSRDIVPSNWIVL